MICKTFPPVSHTFLSSKRKHTNFLKFFLTSIEICVMHYNVWKSAKIRAGTKKSKPAIFLYARRNFL